MDEWFIEDDYAFSLNFDGIDSAFDLTTMETFDFDADSIAVTSEDGGNVASATWTVTGDETFADVCVTAEDDFSLVTGHLWALAA